MKILLPLLAAAAVSMCGCQSSQTDHKEEVKEMTNETTNEMMDESSIYEDDLTFMVETFGLREEELIGIDLKRLIEDYRLRTMDYTAEEIREILKDQGDMYQDDGTTELFSIFEQEGGALKEGAEIRRIAYYRNPGTLVQKAVFDLEYEEFFVDNPDPHPLTEEQVKLLKELPDKWGITKWDSWYEGEEESGIGSLSWKLVFELEDETYCVYGGYTSDMTHLPETYNDVNKELVSVMKSAK